MKKALLKLLLVLLFVPAFVACEDDDDVIPKISFENLTYEVNETATSGLQVKIKLSEPAPKALSVKYQLAGTAVEGEHYEAIDSKVLAIAAGESEATVFINPKNVTSIDGDKTIEITLILGEGFELSADKSKVTVTLKDNANPPSDAPEVSFTTTNITTNAYLEETLDITIGLSKAFTKSVVVPLTIAGNATIDTDYELTGLDNNSITFDANETSKSFTVKVKYTGEIGIEDKIEIGFANPVVTDYAVKATSNSVDVSIVDPQVDMSAWFNDACKFSYLQTGVYPDGGSIEYRTDVTTYWSKRYYWNTTDNEWKSLSSAHYVMPNPDDSNQWKEYINNVEKRMSTNKLIDVLGQERYERHGGDFFGITKFISNLATYSKSVIASEKGWFRFVTTDANAVSGKVIVPAQTIKLYKIKEGVEWKKKWYDDVQTSESIYFWYGDSRETKGDISKSQNVTAVDLVINRSEGTYNTETKEIIIDISFTCTDADLDADSKYIYSKDGDTYTARIKHINYK